MTHPYPLARKVRDIAYELLAPLTATQARFRFTGRFQDQEIVWNTTLTTLTHYHAEQPAALQPVARSPFMEIGDAALQARAILVALDIAEIDEPAILRTIIMVRQYKRLHAGRHEFGTARVLAP